MPDISTITVVQPQPQVVYVQSIGGSTVTVNAGFLPGGPFSLNGSSVSASLVAGNNITLSQSNSTITIIGGAGGGGAAFTLNASTGSASLVAGAGISLASNLSTITISNSAPQFSLNASSSSVSLVAGLGINFNVNASTITINAFNPPNQSLSGGGTSVLGTAVSLALFGGNNISLASASGAGSLSLTFNASSNALNNVSLLNASSGALSVSAGAGIGIGNAASTITISASVQTSSLSATALGNTLGAASTSIAVSNALNFSGAGIVSVGMNASTITISATTPSVTNYSTITATMTGNTLGAASTTLTIGNSLSISGAGIVSVGASAGTITISAPAAAAGTVISAVQISGNTSGTSSLISNGTVYLQAISLIGLSQSTTTGTASTTSNVISIFGPTYAAAGGLSLSTTGGTVSYSAVNTSSISLTALGNTTSSSSGTFSNLLNISGAGIVSVGVGAQSITISATTPSVTNFSTITGTMVGNVGGVSSTVTIGNSFSLSGAGNAMLSASGATVTISVPVATNYSTISGNIAGNTALSSTFTIGNTFQISLTGGLSGTASGSSITLSGAGAGAAGTQSLSAGANSVTGTAVSLALAAGAGISLATATGAGSLTVTVSNSAPNAAKILMTQNDPIELVNFAITKASSSITGTAGFGSSLFLDRIYIPAPITVTELDEVIQFAFSATNLGAGTLSRSLGIFSLGNNTSLASVTTVSLTQAWTTGTSTAGASTSLTQFQGGWSTLLIQPMTFASFALTPGEYVVGRLHDVAQANSNWSMSLYGVNNPSMGTSAVSAFSASASGVAISTQNNQQIFYPAQMTQNATNNVSWFVSRATSAVTSVASATSSFTFIEAPFVGSIVLGTATAFSGAMLGFQVMSSGGLTGGSFFSSFGQLTIGYIGTGSTTSGLPTVFDRGVMSTGALPTAITATSTAVTYTGSVALQQPYFALVGS